MYIFFKPWKGAGTDLGLSNLKVCVNIRKQGEVVFFLKLKACNYNLLLNSFPLIFILILLAYLNELISKLLDE